MSGYFLEEGFMKAKLFGVLAVALLLAADDAAKNDQDKLQGTWETTAMEVNGQDFAANGVKLKFTFKGNMIIMTGENAEEITRDYSEFRYKLDPSKTPKAIDMTVTKGDRKDSVIDGIYEMKGDTLRICTKIDGTGRPAKFTGEGEGTVLMTLKRAKGKT
jgi:RNA polymerase sigma-70 factor (ECF subfamily)